MLGPRVDGTNHFEPTVVHRFGDGDLPEADRLVRGEPAGAAEDMRGPHHDELVHVSSVAGIEVRVKLGQDLAWFDGVDDAHALVPGAQSCLQERENDLVALPFAGVDPADMGPWPFPGKSVEAEVDRIMTCGPPLKLGGADNDTYAFSSFGISALVYREQWDPHYR